MAPPQALSADRLPICFMPARPLRPALGDAHVVVALKQMRAMRSLQCDRAVSRRRISFVALCVGLDTGAESQRPYFCGPCSYDPLQPAASFLKHKL
jgi:hypothetical protein